MDLVANLLVNVIKITQCLATILTAFACVNRDGLGTSARCVCCNCVRDRMECFHMTSRRPCWCPKTMKRRPCWCPKPVLWELNSFLMQTLSFVPINLRRCWPREWKHSIVWYMSVGFSLLDATFHCCGWPAKPAILISRVLLLDNERNKFKWKNN